MDILIQGKTKPLWYGECGLCGAVLSAKGDELQYPEPGDMRSDAFAWENCISCGGIRSVCFHEERSESAKLLMTRHAYAQINMKCAISKLPALAEATTP